MVSFWALVIQFIKCVKMTIYLFGRHQNMTLRNGMSVKNDKYIFMIEIFFISAWLAQLTNSEFCVYTNIYIYVGYLLRPTSMCMIKCLKINNAPRQKRNLLKTKQTSRSYICIANTSPFDLLLISKEFVIM